MRAALHYCTALVLMALYGGEVCPFLESLTLVQLTAPLAAILLAQFCCRRPLHRLWVDNAPFEAQVGRTFRVEFALFFFFSFALAISNTVVYTFPLGSGLKLVLGLATLGLFAALDLTLHKEISLARHFKETGQGIDPRESYFPLPKKVAFFAGGCAFFLVVDLFLVLNKDLDWLVMVGGAVSPTEAQRAILLEIGFVAAVLLAHLLNLIRSLAARMELFFNNENKVLHNATHGNFTERVPVSTSDEFGIMAEQTNLMVQGLKNSTEELHRTQEVTILTLASLAETRDNETGAHILRTQRYVRVLAKALRNRPVFRDYLDEETIELLFKSAPLHDIGKVGIPDRILLKPDRLTAEEFAIMKTHAALGGDALRAGEKRLGSSSFLHLAREIAYTHHEKWDGTGYPCNLQAETIPISGRLMAAADVYDALISKRIYKEAFSHAKAMEYLVGGSGTHFDPEVINALLAVEPEFLAIATEFQDNGPE